VSISKNLTIVGSGQGSDPTDTILNGGNTSRVLTIVAATVTIRDLTVTGGNGADRTGGIEVFSATLNLERVDLVRNTSSISPAGGNAGGGLGVFAGSTVVVKASLIANNTTQGGASALGGGIFNAGTLSLESTRVEQNTGRGGGGILNVAGGKLTLNSGAVVTSNTATEPAPSGGGIYNKGTIVDSDPTQPNVFGNSPDNCISESPGTGCPA
jgi:predicted outer membrane repeat protein